jgi:hypothetical protein
LITTKVSSWKTPEWVSLLPHFPFGTEQLSSSVEVGVRVAIAVWVGAGVNVWVAVGVKVLVGSAVPVDVADGREVGDGRIVMVGMGLKRGMQLVRKRITRLIEDKQRRVPFVLMTTSGFRIW